HIYYIFSSRRRHTSSKRDWSSDVCSSDLKAMIAIENENESLKGVLTKEYARPALDKEKLGDIIDFFTFKVGDTESRKQDVLGREIGRVSCRGRVWVWVV